MPSISIKYNDTTRRFSLMNYTIQLRIVIWLEILLCSVIYRSNAN